MGFGGVLAGVRSLLRRGEALGSAARMENDLVLFLSMTMLGALAVFFFILYLVQRNHKCHMERLAYEDTLTGLYNKNYLWEHGNNILAASKKSPYAVATLDIEKFKILNDAQGYGYGDGVLRCIARVLQREVHGWERAMRISNDQFALVLGCPSREAVEKRIWGILTAIHGQLAQEGLLDSAIDFACGVCVMTGRDKGAESMLTALDHADIARKSIKNQGGDHLCVFHTAMLRRMQEEKALEDRMAQALAQGEFVPYFQPKVEMKTGRAYGAEALVRWRDPQGRFIPPDSFTPLFERNGFILQVDYAVFEAVCRLQKEWRERGLPCWMISVNMARNHILQPDFVETLVAIARQYQVDPATLEIEITESTFLVDSKTMLDILHKLKKYGFHTAMDDFGSGYSSLTLLRTMPIDVLKIDKEFLNIEEHRERGAAIIASIVEMAAKIDVDVICEGVETVSQEKFLLQVGCRLGQGFLYAQPLEAAEFEAFMAGHAPAQRDGALGDPPAQLIGRVSVQQAMEERLAQPTGGGALLVMELDNFKQANDSLGHLFGDNMLRKAAQALDETFPNAIVGRCGREKFVVLAQGLSQRAVLDEKLEKLKERCREDPGNEISGFVLRVKIGTALYPSQGGSYDQLFELANRRCH